MGRMFFRFLIKERISFTTIRKGGLGDKEKRRAGERESGRVGEGTRGQGGREIWDKGTRRGKLGGMVSPFIKGRCPKDRGVQKMSKEILNPKL